ncbi:peptide deformylase [Pseudoflavonifractor phocaeensis]|uniref:peptide deformylase n=1 Tax=Pseudoflavonifractor phocaeensis TaxID=1870988 RepID=UPI00313CB7CD
MAIRKILTDEDPVLHKKCHPVTQFDEKLGSLLDDLKATLANANGAGLAAPQIGILRRIVIVVDANDEMLELVNPELLDQEGEQDGFEGCLSVPGRWGMVKRPMKVRVKAQDRSGKWFEAEGEEMVARCFCHEIEHLDGHIFTEHTDKLYTSEELDELLTRQEKKRK